MIWGPFITALMTSGVVSVGLFTALVFLSKKWIGTRIEESVKHQYAKDLELFRAQLQADAERSITETRHQLEMLASEHNIRFGKLHETRAELIAELYSKLDDVFVAASRFLASFTANKVYQKVLVEDAIPKMIVFVEKYEKSKIYFNNLLCDKLNIISKNLWTPIFRFNMAIDIKESYPLSSKDDFLRDWKKASKELEDLEVLKKEIEEDFRKLLGV